MSLSVRGNQNRIHQAVTAHGLHQLGQVSKIDPNPVLDYDIVDVYLHDLLLIEKGIDRL